MNDDQAKQSLQQINDQFKRGKISPQTHSALMKLHNAMVFKLTKQLKPQLKEHTQANLYNTMHLLLVYFTLVGEDAHHTYATDIAWLMKESDEDDDSEIKKQSFESYKDKLVKAIQKTYPLLKKVKKPVFKTQDQLYEEALTVKKMMAESPTIPEKAGEKYHIVAMDWYRKWKAYSGWDKVKISGMNGIVGMDTPDGDENTKSTNYYDEDNVNGVSSDDFQHKLQIDNNNENVQVKYPGPMNETPGFDKIVINEPYLQHPESAVDKYQLKLEAKEDEDFVILPDAAWHYLYEIYDGVDMPRYSIELAVDADDDSSETKKEFMIEVFHKKLQIFILPKIRNHLCLKKPASIYISRQATVLDLRVKIAEIL